MRSKKIDCAERSDLLTTLFLMKFSTALLQWDMEMYDIEFNL